MVALGIAHGNNFLKFRILEALMWADEPLTTRDIEKILGVNALQFPLQCPDTRDSQKKW